jgi:PEP-CTERM motif
MNRWCFGVAAIFGVLFVGAPAQAQLLVDFTGGFTTPFTTSQGTGGWEFSVGATPVTVNALGFWDEGGDGIGNSHQVGLWDSSQNLLRSGTVTNASTIVASTSLDGRWLFVSIPQITLSNGTFVVAATYDGRGGADPDLARVAPFTTTMPGITLITGRQAIGAGLPFPNQVLAFNVFGPTLANLNGAAAPEPGTAALLATGALGALALRRRRK